MFFYLTQLKIGELLEIILHFCDKFRELMEKLKDFFSKTQGFSNSELEVKNLPPKKAWINVPQTLNPSTYALAFLAVFLGSGGGAVSGSVGAAPLFPPRAGFFSGVDFWTPLERFLGDSSLSSPAGDGDRFLLGGESGFLGAAAAAPFPPRPLLGAGASGASTDAGCSSSALAEAAALAAAAPLPLLAGAATSASAATGDLAAIGQVWSLTQFYSVNRRMV